MVEAVQTPSTDVIDLGTTEPTPNEGGYIIDLSAPTENTPLPHDVAARRAFMIKYGKGAQDRAFEELYRDLVEGREENLRNQAAYEQEYQRTQAANQIIQSITSERGKGMSPKELNWYQFALKESMRSTDPKSVFEELYAGEYMKALDRTAKNDEGSWLNDAIQTAPKAVDELKQTGSTVVAQNKYIEAKEEKALEVVKNQSLVGFGLDMAKDIATLGLYSEVKMRGQVEGVSRLYGLYGTNLEEQALALLKMPFEQFKKTFDAITDKLMQDNPSLAVTFIQAVKGQSLSERHLNNVLSAFNLATLPGLGLLRKGISTGFSRTLVKDTENVVKGMVRESASVGTNAAAPAAIAGDIGDYAVKDVTTRLIKRFRGEGIPTQEAVDVLPSIFKTQAEYLKANPGRFGTGLVNQLEEKFIGDSNRLVNTLTTSQRIERTPELAALVADPAKMAALKDNIQHVYTGLSNKVLDISAPYRDPVSNARFIDVAIGQNANTLFMNKQTAENAIKVFGLHGVPDNKGAGVGWYIRSTIPFDETMTLMRDAMITTKESKSPMSMVNSWVGFLRTPEETMSLDQRMNRKIATYAPSNFLNVARDITKDIKAISGVNYLTNKARWDQVDRALKYAKEAVHPDTGEKGYFFRSPGELEEFWQRSFNVMPDEKAINAYFAYVRWADMDYTLRNVTLYRNKSRWGAQQHRFFLSAPNGERIYSEYIDGKFLKELPGGEDTMVWFKNKPGEEKVFQTNNYNPKERLWLKEQVANGTIKVLEVYSSDLASDAIRKMSPKALAQNSRVRYVLVNNVETKPLPWIQIPYREGGHFEHDYEHYIKQARMIKERIPVGKKGEARYRDIYLGDNTIMPIQLESMGKDVAKKLDQVRIYLKDGNTSAARDYARQHLPIEWKELSSWFRKQKDPTTGEIRPPRLSLTERIQVVPKDKMIVDLDKSLEDRFRYGDNLDKTTFRDGTKVGSADKQQQIAFTGERDAYELFTFKDVGTRHNPIYAIEPVKYVDPIPSMNRALARIVNSLYMDDYKIFSIEHWIREAAPHLQPREGELRTSPLFHYYNPDYKKGTPEEIKRQLQNRKDQIDQLLGVPSSTDTMLHSMAQKLADSIYHRFGPAEQYSKPVQAVLLAPVNMLPKLKDPFGFVRSMTFHAKLGLFSIPQILVQAQTFVTIAGVAGMSKAGPGAIGSMLQRWADINANPAILNRIDSYAARMGWKKGQWKEAFEELQKSGFGNVAGEVAQLDVHMSPKVIQSAGKSMLDLGAVFFREGERQVRYGAWYTAFKEFRTAKPFGRITDAERRQILERADLLNVNMSRASSSLLHTGVLSLPSQFLSYQIRTFELFTGKRLTALERARLIGTYGAIYGVPVMANVSGLPLSDYIRQQALSNGYIPGEDTATSTLMEGLPALMLALATGQGDATKGNWYNIQERYAPQGFETIREVMRGDRTVWDIFGGAAFSTFSGTWAGSDGFRTMMLDYLKGGTKYPAKVEDFVDIFKEISSVNNTWKLMVALNTGKWVSKKEAHLTDVSQQNAVFQYLTGLQDTGVSDMNLLSWDQKSQKEMQKYVQERFTREYRRALRAFDVRDFENGQQFMTRAFAWLDAGDFPVERKQQAISMASQDNKTLIERIDWDYFMKDVPEKDKDKFRQIYGRRYNFNRERNQ